MKGVEEDIQEEYDFIEKIGTGAFGHIISVRGKNDGKIYACKIQKNHGKVLSSDLENYTCGKIVSYTG